MKYAFDVGLLVAANVIVYYASLMFMVSNIGRKVWRASGRSFGARTKASAQGAIGNFSAA